MSLKRDKSGTLPCNNFFAARLIPLGAILILLKKESITSENEKLKFFTNDEIRLNH